MNIILHDNSLHLRFAPLTLTRPVGDLRMGILTNSERWAKWIPEATISFQTEAYLMKKFPRVDAPDTVEINADMSIILHRPSFYGDREYATGS